MYVYQSSQPPSGGCVLKHFEEVTDVPLYFQPPSGGCVLKHTIYERKE